MIQSAINPINIKANMPIVEKLLEKFSLEKASGFPFILVYKNQTISPAASIAKIL